MDHEAKVLETRVLVETEEALYNVYHVILSFLAGGLLLFPPLLASLYFLKNFTRWGIKSLDKKMARYSNQLEVIQLEVITNEIYI